MNKKGKKRTIVVYSTVVVTAFLFIVAFNWGNKYTSTNNYCMSCHVHSDYDRGFLNSVHGESNEMDVNCIDCHLPPYGFEFYREKLKSGSKDLYAFYFKDSTEYSFNRAEKTFKSDIDDVSCIRCHDELFGLDQGREADRAHLYYKLNKDFIGCVDCHSRVGHHSKTEIFDLFMVSQLDNSNDLYSAPVVEYDENVHRSFTESIESSNFFMEMVAIHVDSLNDECENLKDFYISKYEVSWDEYNTFLYETMSEGRINQPETKIEIDGVSGPTPPWGNPDQGWGMGSRPAITMTPHAAETFCKWLSSKTGRNYRLPTVEEWKFVADEGKDLSTIDSLLRCLDSDISAIEEIGKYAIFNGNSSMTIERGAEISGNSFFVVNMYGNVAEFTSTKLYRNGQDEYIIKGGAWNDSPLYLSTDSTRYTNHDRWLRSDPQIPKSIWWFSDCNYVGFRVVCETD
jgi:nitrate/TMAO reductase-like tetraheme cytochrome c subunit